jgi:DNA-damage-inducible protein D
MNKKDKKMESKIALFKGKEIRKTIYNDEWWFSVVDIIEVLTDSTKPRDYWYRIKKREKESSGIELSTFCRQLKLKAQDGKMRETEIVNTENAFRIIQSIPSSKAEPFKRWLAKVGYERIQEIEDPELATKRTRALYQAKGYSADWIEKRMSGIAISEELTDEWKNRGAKEKIEYSILTAEISKATFGMTPSEYKELKHLKRENLRDHMNDLELIFSMLGERATTEITQTDNSQGFNKLKQDAKEGGKIAGGAKKALEKKTKKKVSTNKNYLDAPENKKGIE